MGIKIKVTAILSLLLLTSCGFRLKNMNGEHFTKQTTLSIGNHDDEIGTVKELGHLLSKEGFNVVSSQLASNAVKFKDPVNDLSKNEELQKIFNVKDLNSIYSLKLNYFYSKENNTYNNFYLSVIDPNGKVVMYGYDMGTDKTRQYVLKRIAKKLAKQIK